MMGIPVSLLNRNFDATNLIRAVTAAISMTNRLASQLRRKLKHKVLQSHLQALHSMLLVIYFLTPFTMASTFSLFQGFRIIQTRMMVLSVIHGLRPNQKLKASLEGCANLNRVWGSSLTAHNLFAQAFFFPQCVYIRFTHVMNMQPKFYIGSAMYHTLDREYSRSRKFFQLTNDKLVQAELALRYWKGHDNLYIWEHSSLTEQTTDYRCLELALIQEWQPRLNYPFICQFFHPRKGILKKPAMNTNAQFGLATLWRRCKHKFTPIVWNFGPSSIPWGQTTKPDLNKPKCTGQRWGSHSVLYITSIGKQHPGALSHALPSSYRRFHQMVERQTSTPSLSAPCPMVLGSKPSTHIETIPPKVALTSFGIPSPVSHTVFQDGIHQACLCA